MEVVFIYPGNTEMVFKMPARLDAFKRNGVRPTKMVIKGLLDNPTEQTLKYTASEIVRRGSKGLHPTEGLIEIEREAADQLSLVGLAEKGSIWKI